MNSLAKSLANTNLHKVQQVVKWVVYSLLIVNFAFYIYEDWDRAIHTLTPESTLLDWTSEFATSIDTSAWFILLIMFELETYILGDEVWKGWVAHTVRGARIVCFILIAHTVYAFANTVVDYDKTVPVENVSNLCDMADAGVSFVYNLDYTVVNAETCARLSDETQIYRLGNDPLVTTYDGLQLERGLAWSDLIEVIVWLLIILAMEVVVRLQNHGVAEGPALKTANRAKLFLYAILFVLAVYWASLTHWLYTWDTFVWIGGFAAIEMNVSEWRSEILDQQESIAVTG